MREYPPVKWAFFAVLILALFLFVACDDSSNDDDDDNSSNDDDDTSPVDDDASPADDDDTSPGTDDDDDDDNDNDSSPGDDDDDDQSPLEPIDYADPLIGTGGFGYGYAASYPGPKAPFSLMSVSPDTTFHGLNFGFQHFSGYYYPDPEIRGFSLTHLHGTGAPEYGTILFMPTNVMPDSPISGESYRSEYWHINEQAAPGYYSVYLDTPETFVEITTRDSATIHRYTFMNPSNPHVFIYPSHSLEDDADDVRAADVLIDPATQTVTGMIDFWGSMIGRGDYGLYVYFAAKFSEPFTAYGTFKEGWPDEGQAAESGPDIGAYLRFSPDLKEPLLMKVAISYQSVEQAQANLDAQIPEWDFDGTLETTRDEWRDLFAKIDLVGGTERQRRIFYTALYHAYLMPTHWTESNNSYLGFDQAVHEAGDTQYYTDFSLWDTFHTEHPLLFLLEPEISGDMMQSLVRMYEQGGSVPRWPIANDYTGCMIGTSADIVFAEAYLKNIPGWDAAKAYEGCYAHATGPVPDAGRDGLEDYINVGYLCEENHGRGVSDLLEYCYDDWALSGWADAMGLAADAEMFYSRSKNYVNHWNPDRQFLEPRHCEDGSFFDPLLPSYPFSDYYVEGDAWHWTFYVIHDPEGLAALFGSDEAFVDKLNFAFEKGYNGNDNSYLPDGYYWYGNEMNLYHNFLFNHAGRPDLTQKWTRWVLEAKFDDQPAGFDGNDDCGTLSSWYIFAALGFYPIAGSDRYTVNSPLFDGATLHLPGGDFVISTENNSPENVYIQSVTLNGEELTEPFFTHDQIVNGGELHFVLGSEPSAWGR